MTFSMKLARDLVAVRPHNAKPKRGAVLVPDWQKSLEGEVLGIGPKVSEILPGDTVVFGAAKGMEAVYNGAAIRIMRFIDVDMILGGDDGSAS